jgi:predicted MFS family arabinose efflux permease
MRRDIALTASGTALIAGTYGLARYGYGLFVPVFREEFALSAGLLGLLATGAYGSYCLAALFARRLLARGRPRQAAVVAGTLASLGCAGVAAAPTPALLGAALLVAGSGAGLASPALVHLVAEHVATGRRERAQTVVNAGTGLGVVLAGPLALTVGGQWRAAWWCFAAVTAAATAATLLTAEDARGRAAATPRAPLARLRPAVIAALVVGAGSAAVWTFGRDLVVTTGGLGPVASTAFWVVLGAAGVTGGGTGDAVRRWDVPSTWNALALALAASTTGLALLPDVAWAAFCCAGVFGASYVALSGVLIAWGTQLAPESPGSANATLFLALAAGQAIGALLLGGLLDVLGPLATFAVAAVVTLAGCGPRQLLGVARALRRPRRTSRTGS